jgi:uncharacterized membrane protein YeaQ/YmgE (transglycosylase-associated protein family)
MDAAQADRMAQSAARAIGMGLDQTQTVIALLSGIGFGLITGIVMGGFAYIVRNMVAGFMGAYLGLWWLPRFGPGLGISDAYMGLVTQAVICALIAITLLRITDW